MAIKSRVDYFDVENQHSKESPLLGSAAVTLQRQTITGATAATEVHLLSIIPELPSSHSIIINIKKSLRVGRRP